MRNDLYKKKKNTDFKTIYMKKIAYVFFGVLILVACSSNEEFVTDGQQGQDTEFISISAEKINFEKRPTLTDNGISTRTELTYDTHFSTWRQGDEIGAVTLQSGYFNTQSKLTLDKTGYNSMINSGVFSGENVFDLTESYFFYYPYNKKLLRGGKIIFDMPIQTETGNYSFENFATCDFLYTNELLLPKANQRTILADQTAKLEFTHGVGAIQLEISKSSFQNAGVEEIKTLYYVELKSRSGENLFPQRATIDVNGNLDFSEKLRSIFLFAGENGFDLTKADSGFGGFLLLFPTGDDPTAETDVQFLIHTDAGVFIANKILPQAVAHHFFNVSFNNATLSEDIFYWNKVCKAPTISGSNINITEAAELAWIAAISNGEITDSKISDISFKGFTISLMNDIDLGGKNWSPINGFKGTIEGNNKTISNLRIISNKNDQGLIGINKGGVIKDLTLYYPEIVVRANNVGAFVGNSESGVIANCKVSKGTVNGINNIGGLIGNDNYTLAKSCSNDGTIVTALRDNIDKRVGNPSLE